MSIVHHHLIYQTNVGRTDLGVDAEPKFRQFFSDLLKEIDMQELIPPQFKLSHQAWTGLIGIITSHISFHYWVEEQYVQSDIYSCKEFDKQKTVNFLDTFWKARDTKTLFIDREMAGGFKIIDSSETLAEETIEKYRNFRV